MKSPCYNPETKTDCPDRSSGCAVTCPKWAEYVQERDAEYDRRKAETEAKATISENRSARWARSQKQKTRNNWKMKNYKG